MILLLHTDTNLHVASLNLHRQQVTIESVCMEESISLYHRVRNIQAIGIHSLTVGRHFSLSTVKDIANLQLRGSVVSSNIETCGSCCVIVCQIVLI